MLFRSPTEDFVHHSFCWKIDSALRESEAGNWLEPDVHHMLHLMEKVMHDSSLQRAAFVLGPLHVAANYTWDNAVQKIFDLAG